MQDASSQSASTMNAEMFARGKDNIGALLALLPDQADFYIRYHTVQLLTALAHSSVGRVTQVSLPLSQLAHSVRSIWLVLLACMVDRPDEHEKGANFYWEKLPWNNLNVTDVCSIWIRARKRP